MNRIVYDESGRLVRGAFFELRVPFTADEDPLVDQRDGWICSPGPDDEDRAYAIMDSEIKWLYECPSNPKHETGIRRSNYSVELDGGSQTRGLVHEIEGLTTVVDDWLAGQMVAQEFKGFKLWPLPVHDNLSRLKDPKLHRLESLGKPCHRAEKVEMPDGNCCPYCGWGPVYCETCRDLAYECGKCKRRIIVSIVDHKGPKDPRWRRDLVSPHGQILEGRRWDGSDLISGFDQGFVSRRVVDWLLSIHAGPFYAKACRVNVEGMDEESVRQIERLALGSPGKSTKPGR